MSIQKSKNKKRSRLFIFPLSVVGALLMMVLWISLLTVFQGAAVQSALALGGGNGVITHTLVTDFTANCTVTGSGFPTTPVFVNTTASQAVNGEVRLAATLEDYFNGTILNSSLWLDGEVYDWYSSPVVVSGGNLRLDANYVRSQQAFTQSRRFFEARTIVTSGVITAANTDQGFYRINPPLVYTATTPDTEAIRLFVVANSGANNIYARARNGGSSVNLLDSDISPDPDLTQTHLYRIEWDTTQTRFYIDNILETTIYTDASTLPGYAFLYHQDPTTSYNTGPMLVDWARAGIYPTTGSYVSCVQDALGTVNFSTVAAVTNVPTGSGLTIETRTSNDGIAWSNYQAISGSTINSPSGRYLQYRLSFTSSTQFVSAEVQQLRFNYYGPSVVQINPTNPTVNPGATQQFTVQTLDTNGQPVANLDYTWSLVAGGGTINTSGLFTAGLTSGTFNNTVRVSTPLVGGGSLSSVTSVTVPNLPPIAEAGGPYSGAEGTSINFTGTGSDPNGGTVTFAWDLDDNGSYETSGQNVSRTFPDSGTFTVRLRVTDSTALSTTDTATVNVSNVAPTITGVTGTTTLLEGGSTTVTVTATDPAGANDPLSYSFDCRNDGTYEIGPQSGNQTTCAYGDNGTFTVNVRVTDGDGGEDTDTSLVVTVTNIAPTIANVTGTTTINEGASTAITVTATDPAGANDPLLYSFDCRSDGTFEIVPQSSNIGNCTYGDNGTYTVNVRVTDGDGGEDTDNRFVVTVNNVAPVVTSLTGTATINEGGSTTVTANVTDPAGANDPLSYSFDCRNDGTYETGPQASNQATCSYGDNGAYTINVRVTDGDGGEDTDTSFVVTVNNVAPSVTNVTGTTPILEGESTTVTVTATDPAGVNDTLSYSFDCRNDGEFETGPQASNQANCAYIDNGPYTVRVRVADEDGGATINTSFVVTVNNVAPTITAVTGTASLLEGGSTTVTATAIDPAGTSDPLSYSFDCRNDGAYEIGPQASNQATCSYLDNGTFTVKVLVSDGDGGQDTDTSFVVTVANVAPTITNVTGTTPINEGGSSTVTVTATDPAGANDLLSYSFDCQNDGTYEIAPQSNNQAACIMGDNGVFTVNVRVTDGDGGEDTDTSFEVTVNNVNPVISGLSSDTSVQEGSVLPVTVTASDPAGLNDPLVYRFDCDEDGTFEISQSSNIGNCVIYDQGVYTITVRVEDGDGGFDLETKPNIAVSNVAPTVAVSSNSPVPTIKPAVITITATDPAGAEDPLAYQFDCDDDGTYEIGPQAGNTAQCSFTAEGTYTVRVRVDDGDGGVILDSTVVEVRWAAKIRLPFITKP